MKRILAVAVSLFLTWFSGAALAQGTPFASFQQDPDAPVEIESDALEFDQNGGEVLFIGNVQIVQGDLTLSADRVLVSYADGPLGTDVTRMQASGDVRLVSPSERIEGAQADYDIAAGTLTVTGGVLLVQGQNALSAERADIDLEGGTGAFAGRVRSVFVPEEE
ncbi:MAG: LptA/OstA family protein [Rubricella sp.]